MDRAEKDHARHHANGGAVSDPIGTTPVLIRLSDFNFGAAKEDGSDIRILADDDKTLLPYHIENLTHCWARLRLGQRAQPQAGRGHVALALLGNQGDTTVPNDTHAKPTYDASTALVYHFADKIGTAPVDASGQGNNASNPGLSDDGALIGPGLRLDGKSAISIPTSASLAWTAGSALTWSAWIKPAALAPNAIIFSRRDGDNALLIGLDNGVPFVEINGTRNTTGAPVAINSWHHVAAVADSGKVTLYSTARSTAAWLRRCRRSTAHCGSAAIRRRQQRATRRLPARSTSCKSLPSRAAPAG